MFNGYKRDKILPFFKVLSFDDAWDKASSVVKPKIARENKRKFRRSYNIQSKALESVIEKYGFYLKVLEKDSPEREQYVSDAAPFNSIYSSERVAYSLHRCINKGEHLSGRINNLIADFPLIVSGSKDYVTFSMPSINYESIDDSLPSFKVLSFKSAWKKAGSALKPDVARENKDGFEDSYKLYSKALELIGERYKFYLNVLDRDPNVMADYGEQIGLVDLNERVVYAMHHCISKGENISGRLNDLTEKFPMIASRSREYVTTSMPLTDCESTGVCLCEGSIKPYMWGCMPSDYSKLMEDDATYQKRMRKNMEDICKSISSSLEFLAEQES